MINSLQVVLFNSSVFFHIAIFIAVETIIAIIIFFPPNIMQA